MSEMGFGNDEYVENDKFEKFKLDKVKRRIAIIFHNKSGAVRGTKYHSHGSDKNFRQWRCLSTKDRKEDCCTLDYEGNTPKGTFVAAIIEYKFEKRKGEDGSVKDVLVGYTMWPWAFKGKTYAMLTEFDKKYDIASIDIEICLDGDPKYQKPAMLMEKTCLVRQNPKLLAKVLAEYDKKIPLYEKQFLPRKMSISDIKEILGVDQGGDYGDTGSGAATAIDAEFEV